MRAAWFKLVLGAETCLVIGLCVASHHFIAESVKLYYGRHLEITLAGAGMVLGSLIALLTYKLSEVIALALALPIEHVGVITNKYSVSNYSNRILKLEIRLDQSARLVTIRVDESAYDTHTIGQRIVLLGKRLDFLAKDYWELPENAFAVRGKQT